MTRKLYQQIANTLQAMQNCEKSGNDEWRIRHYRRLAYELTNALPSGSGFDSGSNLDVEESKPERLVFNTGFHHMNQDGFYCGWSNHQVIVTSSLVFGFQLRVTGLNTRGIKDYIAEVFEHALNSEFEWKIEESASRG
jgi:hypothetical protein